MGAQYISVVPFEILHSQGPFEVTSFKHFSFEKPFNGHNIEGFLKTEVFKTGHFRIVHTLKCPSEADLSHLGFGIGIIYLPTV